MNSHSREISNQAYVGRFAPSPSGPLHQGSMLAALASWLDARAHGGQWLLRMEDLDGPRVQPGAADTIIRQLTAFALEWDADIIWQSRRQDAYAMALQKLEADGMLFRCTCSRKTLSKCDTGVYPGTCRNAKIPEHGAHAIRVKVGSSVVTVRDRVLPDLTQYLGKEVGDFIVKRRDNIIAYQLAVVVDDRDQGVTHVVRGADIHNSTPRQQFLQKLLNATSPNYAHTPLLVYRNGSKLSKQNHAPGMSVNNCSAEIEILLRLLNHPPPSVLTGAPPTELLDWAQRHWSIQRLRSYQPPPVQA